MNVAPRNAAESSSDLTALWHAAIAGFDLAGDSDLSKLRDASLRFIASEWLPIAIAQEWDELELWGCFPAPLEFARRRLDCLGLVPSLALGRGCTLIEIGRDAAAVTRRDTGSRLRRGRTLGGKEWAKPWWQALSADARKGNSDV